MATSPRWSLLIFSVMLLALMLMFDEVIFYLLFERLLGWKLSWPVKIAAGAIFTLFNFALALLIMKALNRQPQTGAEGMIGGQGIVVSVAAHDYRVKIHGELWRAQALERLEAGEKIVVRKVNGLTLEIARLDG